MQESPELSFSESPIIIKQNDRLMCAVTSPAFNENCKNSLGIQTYQGTRDFLPDESCPYEPVLRGPVSVHCEEIVNSNMKEDTGTSESKWDRFRTKEQPPPPELYHGRFSPKKMHDNKWRKQDSEMVQNCHSRFSAPQRTVNMREEQSGGIRGLHREELGGSIRGLHREEHSGGIRGLHREEGGGIRGLHREEQSGGIRGLHREEQGGSIQGLHREEQGGGIRGLHQEEQGGGIRGLHQEEQGGGIQGLRTFTTPKAHSPGGGFLHVGEDM